MGHQRLLSSRGSALGHQHAGNQTVKDKSVIVMIALTFLGMIGLYVILYRAYQKYQESTAKGTVAGSLLGLFSGG